MNKTQRAQLEFFANNAYDYALDAHEDLLSRFSEFQKANLEGLEATEDLVLCVNNFLSAADDLMFTANEVLADLHAKD